MKTTWIALAGLSLAGCGGGGGRGAPFSLTLTPSPVAVTTYEGESQPFAITANLSRTITEPVNVAIVEPTGAIAADVTLRAVTDLEFRADLWVSPALPAGQHTGDIEVRLCRDSPLVCARPYGGSPWRVPFSFTVLSGTNLTSLAPLDGAGPWSTFQGNAAHTGHVPGTLDASAFNRRYRLDVAASPIAVANGVLVAVSGSDFGAWTLRALDEASGDELWSTPLGALYHVNPPALSGGKVYVTSTGHEGTAFWVFDAGTGAQLAKVPMSSQWETYLAPTVRGGLACTNSGYFGGLACFDTATAELAWWVALAQYDAWTPAMDDAGVYAYVGGRLSMLAPADGAVVAQIDDPEFDWASWSMHGAPVLDGAGGVYVVNGGFYSGRLVKFDVRGRTVAWSVAGAYLGNPTFVDGVLYVLNGRTMQARSAATGDALWAWAAPEAFDNPFSSVDGANGDANGLIVVGKHAFVSTVAATYAIDLMTHQAVWRYPNAGALAVSSNGVLYLSTLDGKVVALNLH
jgi:hypothetical protein